MDYLVPDDEKKLSDELKHLRDHPEDFEFSDGEECYVIENIGGLDKLLVHVSEFECL